MTKKLLFLAALATTLSFAACNKDTEVDKGKNSGVEGYLTVKLSAPQTRTSPGSDGTEVGTPEESTISTVTAVFTGTDGTILFVKNPGLVPSTTTTEKFTVEIGAYQLYVLVNNPSDNAIVVGDNIERVIDVLSAEDAEKGYLGGDFFMVNARHNSGEEAGVDVNITALNTEDSPLHATVNVDRVAVKVMLATDAVLDFPVSGDWLPDDVVNFHIEGFAMLNINKNFNLIQQWGNENLNGDPIETTADVLQTPLYPGTGLVKDQYFRNISEFTTLEADAITDISKGIANLYTTDIKYAIENRPTIIQNALRITAGMGETTGVIFKVVAQDAGGSAVGTFFSYREKFYTSTNDIEADGYFVGELNAMTIPQMRAEGIQVYEDGVMYYTYFILDPNTTYQYKAENYYGVFRNSVYRLTVNGFSDLGDDVPGGGKVDPNDPGEPGNPPIDKDEAYIEVEITINPWVLNVIGIEF